MPRYAGTIPATTAQSVEGSPSCGDSGPLPSPLVIAEAVIGVKSFHTVHFARVGPEFFRSLQGSSRHLSPMLRVIEAFPVKIEVRFAHERVGTQKFRIAPHRFLQQTYPLK